MIKQRSTKIVYQNKWMKVREDQVEFANGSTGIYGVVKKPDFAMVIPWENNGFHLVKQFRYPVGESYWEFPQGSYEDNADINPIDLARGELEEETGLHAEKMEKVGYLYEAYGYCDQAFHIFLAQDLKRGEQKLEESEQGLETKFFTIQQVEEMIVSGELVDAPSISAYGLLKAKKII